MASKTKIQWCTYTQNFHRGCSKVHVGCTNCYVERNFSCAMHRVAWGTRGQGGNRVVAAASTWNNPFAWNRNPTAIGRERVFAMSLGDLFEDWDGPMVNGDHERLWVTEVDPSTPIRKLRDIRYRAEIELTRSQRRDFRPATMSDVRQDALAVIRACDQMDWLILTKHGLWTDPSFVLKNWPHQDASPILLDHVWLLGSVADHQTAEIIIPRSRRSRKPASAGTLESASNRSWACCG